jgi:hypothetical protein
MSSDARNDMIQGWPEEELQSRRIPARTLTLGPELSEASADEIVRERGSRATCWCPRSCASRPRRGPRTWRPRTPADPAAVGCGAPVIVASFGSPYLLRQFPDVPVYLRRTAPPRAASGRRSARCSVSSPWRAGCL